MKGVQCYELFGGIALKNHTISFHFIVLPGICASHLAVMTPFDGIQISDISLCCLLFFIFMLLL